MPNSTELFRMEGISKRYGGVHALEKADLSVHSGRVHAILGENGAGKSTLMKILAGAYQRDSGRIFIKGILFLDFFPHRETDMHLFIFLSEDVWK